MHEFVLEGILWSREFHERLKEDSFLTGTEQVYFSQPILRLNKNFKHATSHPKTTAIQRVYFAGSAVA